MMCLLGLVGWNLPASARKPSRPDPQTAIKLMDRGIRLYHEGQYEQAIAELSRALQGDLEPNRQVGALQYLAFAQAAIGEFADAEKTFERLLHLKPDFQLPTTTSPKIADVFAAVRERVKPPPAAEPASIEHQVPDHGSVGRTLEIEATVNRLPAGGKLRLRYRYDSASKFSTQVMTRGPEGKFTGRVPAPFSPTGGKVQYFIEAIDDTGVVVSAMGEEKDPLAVDFLPNRGGVPPPIREEKSSSTWWIWALVGGVLAGAGLAVGLSISGGSSDGGRAIVTIRAR